MAEQVVKLGSDAAGISRMVRGTVEAKAVANFMRGRGARDIMHRLSAGIGAKGLSRPEAIRRFRLRIVYPAAAFALGLPLLILVIGAIGAINRDELAAKADTLLFIAGACAAVMLFTYLCLFTVWRGLYRAYLDGVAANPFSIALDADGLSVTQDGETILAGPWQQLTLAAVTLRSRSDQDLRQHWDLERLTVSDSDGRVVTLAIPQIDRGKQVAQAVIAALMNAGRLKRERAG